MRRLALLTAAILLAAGPALAENWPQWRGPFFNGSTSETGLPSRWSRSENIAWSAELPGPAAATPIVWEDRVFLSSTETQAESLCALAIDRRTGRTLWQHTVAQGLRQDSRSNYASPSPVTDGKSVVFFYGTGDLAAFDRDGNRLWQRNLQQDYGPFAFLWTFSSSPLLLDNKLYLQVLQRDVPVDGRGLPGRNESYLLALELETGRTLWRQVRPSQARAESREAFSTPIPLVHEEKTQLLIAGGDDLTGHDAATGEELWRWATWNPQRIEHWRLVPSPVTGAGLILVCAPKNDPIYAVRAGGRGQLNDRALAWTTQHERELTSDVPTPAFYDGDFFVLSDLRKSLSRIDPRNGAVRWTVRTPGTSKYEASPLAADGKIYVINFIGDVVVFDADQGSLLHTVSMDEPADDAIRSSLVAAGGQLFIRTNTRLYCVGNRRDVVP